jgi:hypothetical protein
MVGGADEGAKLEEKINGVSLTKSFLKSIGVS